MASETAYRSWPGLLYLADSTNGLGVARIAVGTSMSMTVAVVVVWAFGRSSKRLLGNPRPPSASSGEHAS